MQHKIKDLFAACPEAWSPMSQTHGLGQSQGRENKSAPGSTQISAEPGPLGESPADGLNEQWVVRSLVEVALRCMQAVEPPAVAPGKPCGEWKFDTGGAIRALTLLGKHLGMFSERVEHQINVHEDALDELE